LDGPFHPAFEVDEDKVEEREMQEITLLLSDVKQLYAGVPPWPISSHVQLLNRHFYKTKRVLDTSTGCRMTVFKLFALQIASDAGPFLFVDWQFSLPKHPNGKLSEMGGKGTDPVAAVPGRSGNSEPLILVWRRHFILRCFPFPPLPSPICH
jgi:hypothetical protein